MSASGDAERDVVEHAEAVVERKADSLPRFVVVPDAVLSTWGLEGTTMVEVAIDGCPLGRRSLKAWPDRGGWFFDLTEAQAGKAGVQTGDRVRVTLRRASTTLPEEISRIIESDAGARARWHALTEARKRMVAEHVRGATRPETRSRRAAKALGTD